MASLDPDGAAANSVSAVLFSSVDKFLSIVDKKGLHDPSKYKITLTAPGVGTLESDNALYCKGLNVKGASFSTVNRFTHGPERDVPYLETYSDGTSLTFYNDYEYTEYNYFLKWMQYIGGEKGQDTWYIKWYKQFVGELYIETYDEKLNPRLGISLNEVYPKSLSDISLAYDLRGREISTFTVNLAFHHYEIQHWPDMSPGGGGNNDEGNNQGGGGGNPTNQTNQTPQSGGRNIGPSIQRTGAPTATDPRVQELLNEHPF